MPKFSFPCIVLATSNPHKAEEIRAILGEMRIPLKTLNAFPAFPPVKETGLTYEENAILKARETSSTLNLPSIADDSGFEVDALDQAPGVYSRRFLGEETSYVIKNSRILEMLKDVPDEKRGARFVCVAAIAFPGGKITVVREETEGRVARQAKGENGFGYDPIFFLPDLGKTMAELSPEEKNRVSHRAKAFHKLASILLSLTES